MRPRSQKRRADPDYIMTSEDEALLTRRVVQTDAASKELLALLQALVDETPWIPQFGAASSFGIGQPMDPYCRLCRAECMLALLILHVEEAQVNFLEEDRLEVLANVPVELMHMVSAVRAVSAEADSRETS